MNLGRRRTSAGGGDGGKAKAGSDCADVFEGAAHVHCGWWVDVHGRGLGGEVQKVR